MYATAWIAIFFISFLIQAVRPLPIRPAENGKPDSRHSSQGLSVRPYDPTGYKTHNSQKVTQQDKSRESFSSRTDPKHDTSEEIGKNLNPVVAIVEVSTPPMANTETNVLLYPRKRDASGGNSGCCSGNSVSVGAHVSCNLPCLA
jgi:hypothetical protein